MKRASLLVVFLFAALSAFATIFGTVRGIVHDPQHRPVPDATVALSAKTSSYVQTAQTDVNGEFHFDAVPLGAYRVTISSSCFAGAEQTIAVLSATAPILDFDLKLGSQAQSSTPSAHP